LCILIKLSEKSDLEFDEELGSPRVIHTEAYRDAQVYDRDAQAYDGNENSFSDDRGNYYS